MEGKGLNLKNFSLDTNIYIYTLDEFVYRIIVRDFEKWRLEVSFGSFDRKRAEREREIGKLFREDTRHNSCSPLFRAARFQTLRTGFLSFFLLRDRY